MRALWAAVALFACGEVNKIPDAAVPDAYAPDSPSTVNCAAGEMSCGGTCADLMTSEEYCGDCNTQCAPNQICSSGACVAFNTDCLRVKELDPAATDGIFTNPNTLVSFYCDFSSRVQYQLLSTTLSGTPPTGYVIVRASDLASAIISKAFIALYNHHSGLPVYAPFTLANCCFKVSANTFMMLDGGWMGTNPCTANMTGTFRFGESGAAATPPLADNHFTLNIPTEGPTGSCSDTTNPMMIWQKKPF